MKNKILLLGFILLISLTITACDKESKNSDAMKFKEEYESINGTLNSSDKEHRTLSIAEDNPFIYATAEEIVSKIENGDTFYVYFGSAYCPWCRSVIEEFISVANDNKIDTVYYVDIWDGDHVEILRDKYELNDEGIPELVSEGDKNYKEILKYFDNVLEEYTLTDKDGNQVSVGEKRIFAPNFIYVENGESKTLVSGISDKQNDSREELTDEILEDERKIFNNFFNNK